MVCPVDVIAEHHKGRPRPGMRSKRHEKKKTAIIVLHAVNWLVFVMFTGCFYEVGIYFFTLVLFTRHLFFKRLN